MFENIKIFSVWPRKSDNFKIPTSKSPLSLFFFTLSTYRRKKYSNYLGIKNFHVESNVFADSKIAYAALNRTTDNTGNSSDDRRKQSKRWKCFTRQMHKFISKILQSHWTAFRICALKELLYISGMNRLHFRKILLKIDRKCWNEIDIDICKIPQKEMTSGIFL